MSAQHTPGPWLIEKIGPDDWQINSDLRDYCLFDVTPRIGLKHLTTEDKANARLIAAAPEMLEALQYAQAVVQKQLTTRTKQEYCIDKISAAIANATGSSTVEV